MFTVCENRKISPLLTLGGHKLTSAQNDQNRFVFIFEEFWNVFILKLRRIGAEINGVFKYSLPPHPQVAAQHSRALVNFIAWGQPGPCASWETTHFFIYQPLAATTRHYPAPMRAQFYCRRHFITPGYVPATSGYVSATSGTAHKLEMASRRLLWCDGCLCRLPLAADSQWCRISREMSAMGSPVGSSYSKMVG